MPNQGNSPQKEASNGLQPDLLNRVWEEFQRQSPLITPSTGGSKFFDKFLLMSGLCCMYNLMVTYIRSGSDEAMMQFTAQVMEELNEYFSDQFEVSGPSN